MFSDIGLRLRFAVRLCGKRHYSVPIGQIQPRLQLTITCTAPACTTRQRSTHEFSRQAYEKGIVLVQCPACQTRHLVADHLGWFSSDDLTQGGKYKTLEELMASKGEQVRRGEIFVEGYTDQPSETADGELTDAAEKK